jgi:hypothetical protein
VLLVVLLEGVAILSQCSTLSLEPGKVVGIETV